MANETNQFGEWQPWRPHEVARFFATLTVPWWIAGGWALDLFLGRETRAHEDIDVQFLRRDAQAVRALFQGWDVEEVDPSNERSKEWPFQEWKEDMPLSPGVHDIWCRPNPTAAWALQFMVADTTDEQWLFRRDPRIRRPLATIGRRTAEGLPYLAPEIQLLYKAKNLRPKDEADFAQTLPSLDGDQRQWLAQALAVVHPGHSWLLQLEGQE